MIGLFNIDKNMSSRLAKYFDIDQIDNINNFSHLNGLFVDWVEKSNSKKGVKQAAIIDAYTKKKIPIVVFDRYFSMTRKEYDWLKKFKIFFFEPAINNRRGFAYLPQWIVKPDYKWYEQNKGIREFDIVYKCDNLDDNLKNFEKYYLKYAKLYPDVNIVYSTNKIDFNKSKKYKEYDVKKLNDFSFSQSYSTIIIDTQKNYDIGYLNQYVFEAMENNCLPLLPIEHKYFHAMFDGLVIKNMMDLDYYVDLVKNVKELVVDEVYDNIEKLYPEFMIDNTVEVIKNCFK